MSRNKSSFNSDKFTEDLYEKLCDTNGLYGELILTTEKCIRWTFKNYISFIAFIDDGNEGYIEFKPGQIHWHPDGEEMYEKLCKIAKGEMVFITKVGLFGRYCSGIYEMNFFEKYKKFLCLGLGTQCVTAKGIISK